MYNIGATLHNRLYERSLSNACEILARDTTLMQAANIPESPAINILSLPMLLPFSVKGLLLGICMLGMTSCELLLPSMTSGECDVSSSPLDRIAWLPPSSVKKSISISEFCRESCSDDVGLRIGDSRKDGVIGSDGAAFGEWCRRDSDGDMFLLTSADDFTDRE